jgi:hypothetical protein
MVLSRDAVAIVLSALSDNKVLQLDREIHTSSRVPNRAQWVLLVTQGKYEKIVYLDGHFPAEIIRFADALDNLLIKNGALLVKWQPVANADAVQFTKQIWDRIKKP